MPNSNSLIKAVEKRLAKRRLFYVCRDIERAAGLRAKNYFVIANHTNYAAKLARQDSNIILIKEKNQLDTQELLKHPRVEKIIRKNDFVLVFKNNSIIEDACQKHGWHLLNPGAKLADKIESKISQIEWLGHLAKYLPKHRVDICQNIKWPGKPFILQYNHAHTGSGTLFINTKKRLNELAIKFPKRPVRISQYIEGPAFTNNNVVWDDKILMGNINYQITGLAPFTDNKFATIGNDWMLPSKVLSTKQIKQYKQIVTEIGRKLSKDGWKGLFGIDIIMDEKNGRLYLLEINARQPASTTFESQLQKSKVQSLKHAPYRTEGSGSRSKVSTFEAHLASLLDLTNKEYKLISVHDGAQIIQRVTKKKIKIPKIKNKSILNIIAYNNTAIGADLTRIQCSHGIMQTANTFNKIGKEIRSALKK